LYERETWSPTLREECKLRVYENRVLMRILEPKRNEIIGGWRKVHKEEFDNLYPSPPNTFRMIKSRRIGGEGYVACMKEKRTSYRILMRKPKGERPLGRLTHRLEENIKTDLREIGRGGMEWIRLVQDRDQWTALLYPLMSLRVP
jgi:hypothetical protein